MQVNAIILAAGKGTRMNSDLPKCAQLIIDKPMIEYVVEALADVNPTEIVTVVGYKREVIEKILNQRTKFAIQEDQLGTAHAVMMTKPFLEKKEGSTIIAIGDMPFISKQTYYNLLNSHLQENNDITILTTSHPNPFGYGRIVRDECGNVLEIVEEKDCSEEQRQITEINSSVYVVDNKRLFSSLNDISNNNKQKEYYLTDIVKIFKNKKYKIGSYKIDNYHEISGVNDKYQLMEMETTLQDAIIKKHLLSGITIDKPSSVVIGASVVLSPGVIIRPGSIVVGNTIVGNNSTIGPNSEVVNSRIGQNVVIKHSIIEDSNIGDNQVVGPFVSLKGRNL